MKWVFLLFVLVALVAARRGAHFDDDDRSYFEEDAMEDIAEEDDGFVDELAPPPRSVASRVRRQRRWQRPQRGETRNFTLQVLAMSDWHGNIDPVNNIGGAAALRVSAHRLRACA